MEGRPRCRRGRADGEARGGQRGPWLIQTRELRARRPWLDGGRVASIAGVCGPRSVPSHGPCFSAWWPLVSFSHQPTLEIGGGGTEAEWEPVVVHGHTGHSGTAVVLLPLASLSPAHKDLRRAPSPDPGLTSLPRRPARVSIPGHSGPQGRCGRLLSGPLGLSHPWPEDPTGSPVARVLGVCSLDLGWPHSQSLPAAPP